MSDDYTLTIDDVARITGFAKSTLYHAVRDGKGPRHITILGRLRFRRADIDTWISDAMRR